MQRFNQVSGGNCRLAMFRETSPGKTDPADKGVVLAFTEESFSAPSNKQGSAVITGKRGQGKPTPGAPDYTGGLKMAPYAPIMGHVLRALCGAPSTSAEPSLTLAAEPVADEGQGCVSLPCTGNAFVQDTVITVTGTDHYNGTYRLEYGTDASKLVIKKRFTAETLTATARAHRGLGAFLQGAARDMGQGRVGLPVSGVGVALHAGETVAISGTTFYDGECELEEGTAQRLLVIKATFEDEDLDGTPFAIPAFHRHIFKLPRKQPTVSVEKYLDYDAGAAEYPYTVFTSSKINGLSCSFGGQSDLAFSVDFAVGSADSRPDALSANPVALPSVPFADREVALWLDGDRIGDVQSGELSLAYGIEGASAVGDFGRRSRQPEGDPVCTCKMKAFLEHDEYKRLDDMGATLAFGLSMSGAGGEEFRLDMPEVEMGTDVPPISGKGGVTQDITVTAFVDQAETVNTFTLINRVASYA